MSSNFEINEAFSYSYISIACIFGFLYGMYNWYSVSSIDIRNDLGIKYGISVIEETPLRELEENSRKIGEVN
jgi:hypothetical protein